jgi:hypothetical protein
LNATQFSGVGSSSIEKKLFPLRLELWKLINPVDAGYRRQKVERNQASLANGRDLSSLLCVTAGGRVLRCVPIAA